MQGLNDHQLSISSTAAHPTARHCCLSAGTAIFEFPGGVELKEAFKEQLDEVGRGLSEEEIQQVGVGGCTFGL